MRSKIYIVKNLTPWMMDELKSFSNRTPFKLILLRRPQGFYSEGLTYLENNNIEILIRPFSLKGIVGKLKTAAIFLFSNIGRFDLGYNSVIGFKSLFWFLKLDLRMIEPTCRIHAQFATQPGVLALLIKNRYDGVPAIAFTFHAYDIYFRNSWFDLLVRKSEKAFSISDYNIAYVERNFLKSDNLVLSRLGVFRSQINGGDKDKKEDKFIIGLMSWFVEKKGIQYLLEAMKQLKDQGYDNILLKLAGDGPLYKELTQFVKAHDLVDTVRFIGKIKGEEKNTFYKELDAFILPSIQLEKDQDGIPVVLMEAIAYGLPLISTDVSGIPEICIQDFNGELIPERRPDRIVESILNLRNNKAKVKKYAMNSLKLSDQYDIEINSIHKLKTMNWINNEKEDENIS